ncbi:GFA family protein [Rhodobacteraceae bacterium N5(2021)]|uniref:GFA family protein n=1 Tax=Gymnodinialimonas phycosphaerae TaxID=2841589 RepID=A0A975YI59_9RHOB|nr:GFA family protein [Gymnodinialimonas phycosphaerae]
MTGRCYCGGVQVNATARPQTVSYCHCSDCRRLSGAPVAAFAAFASADLRFTPSKGPRRSFSKGVDRWFCPDCGTQLAATYDYLLDQVYVPLGLLDQANTLAPESHGHTDSALPWLHIEDDLPRDGASSRVRLQEPDPSG